MSHSNVREVTGTLLRRAPLLVVAFMGLTAAEFAGATESAGALTFRVVADGAPDSLAASSGVSARGRALIVARDAANCVLCHAIPDAAIRYAGNLGPSLAGVGARLTTPQLRLRVADIPRINPATIMPSYYKIDGLNRVAPAYQNKPILTAPEIEDVVAYLATLR